jgi:hypothetical protein
MLNARLSEADMRCQNANSSFDQEQAPAISPDNPFHTMAELGPTQMVTGTKGHGG